ncbi:MAG TPA: hypothetical protein VHS54_03775 [Jatrophihabitans sp.]|nr:hypothetical protein [Jatrophihabitans sp.]
MGALDDGTVRNRWSWDEPPPLDDGAVGSVARRVVDSGLTGEHRPAARFRRRTSMRRSALGRPRGGGAAGQAWRPTRGPRSCLALWCAVAVVIVAAVVTVLAVRASHDRPAQRVRDDIVLRVDGAAAHPNAGLLTPSQDRVQGWDKSDNSA